MKLINKIDLGKEFQRIIDSGCKHSIFYSNHEQTIILQKFYVNPTLNNINEKLYFDSLSSRIDDYKLFISLLEDFHIVSTLLMQDKIEGLEYKLIETGMTYKFCVSMKRQLDELKKFVPSDHFINSINSDSKYAERTRQRLIDQGYTL